MKTQLQFKTGNPLPFKKHILFFFVVLTGLVKVDSTFCQVNQQALPEKTRILLLLDASGSMLGPWGKTNRITAAKRLIADMVDSLKANANLELALRVYGHQFHKRFQNCKDTKLEVGFKKGNHQEIIKKLTSLQPKGTTPLAFSLQEAANDFPTDSNVRNIVIIITDGLESCDGDPCEVSVALQKKHIFLKPFIIGLGMNKSFTEAFSCLGQFYDAASIGSFKKVLRKAIAQTLQKTSLSVELLDHQNKPTISNVNVSFVNNVTNETVYNFVHFRDGKGRPDSVEIDAVLGYHVLVNTIPPVIKKNIEIEAGSHNVVSIKAPQGALKINQSGQSEYKNGVKFLIFHRGKMINTQPVNIKDRYLAGKYDVEILTLPKIKIRGLEIVANETNNISIPNPGIINLYANVTGYGSLYSITEDGQQHWIKNLDEAKTRYTMAIQPGEYKLVFRAKNAFGSKYTTIKHFKIKSGSTTNIKLIGG